METQFLFQRLSVILQRFNAVLFVRAFWLPLMTQTCNHSTDLFLTFQPSLLTSGIFTT